MRDQFLKRFDNQSTIKNYHKSFKKFDEYLASKDINENVFFDELSKMEDFEKYNLLQGLISFIRVGVSPRTTKQYFDNLFKYFLMQGVRLDYTQKRLRLQFPRIIERRLEGLDEKQIRNLIELAPGNFGLYLRLLAGSGVRESEGLQITPGMIMFEEFPVRIKLPGEITKFNIPRETFIPPGLAKDLKKLIEDNKKGIDDVLFTKRFGLDTLKYFEESFAKIRKKGGLETPNRARNQQNDITLHSLRAYFITVFTNEGLTDFGHALAGHSASFSIYYRMSEEKRKSLYGSVMKHLDFHCSQIEADSKTGSSDAVVDLH